MASVEHLFIAVVHRFPIRESVEVWAIEEKGFEGCIHGRAGSKRQIILMDAETLERLKVPPGAVKENITTRGLDLGAIRPGDQLQVGAAILDVSATCHPCSRMEEIRQGLLEELRGRRGILCRVVRAGRIRRGDAIEKVAAAVGAGV